MAETARIPSPYSVSGAGSIRPAGMAQQADLSAETRGLANLGAGIDGLGQGVQEFEANIRQRQNVTDIARAEAFRVKGFMDIQNRFNQDGDYETFSQRAEEASTEVLNGAAALIRDPEMRERWTGDAEISRLGVVNAIGQRGMELSNQNDRVNFESSLNDTAQMIMEPTTDDATRSKARRDIAGSIQQGLMTGLIGPEEASKMIKLYIDGAEAQLAMNRAELAIRLNPNQVMGDLGIPTAMGADDLITAQMAAVGGAVPMEYSLAKITADLMGDSNFPSDPALAKAYLADPEVNARYAGAMTEMLVERYKGDITAVVIASAPGGGTELADRWVKSGHDESALPDDVLSHYRKVMTGIKGEAVMPRIPIKAEPGVDLEGVNVAVLDRFEQAQTAFGKQLPIRSGFRDPGHNAEVGGATKSQHIERQALDIDVSSLSEEERIRFIETASAMGFGGIGVYKNTVHIDMGERRAWGPSHHSDSIPAWAKEVVDRHLSGQIEQAPPNVQGVAPEYAALSFDQRLALHDKARQASESHDMDIRAGLQVAMDNAPVAIARSGTYDGQMPEAEDFVRAYGAADGIDRYKTFQASVDVAQQTFSMQTMSADEIQAMVQAAVPTSNGADAALQGKKFETLSAAAKATLEAREADPAGYSMQVFPGVRAAWEDMGNDPKKYAAALSTMALAQQKLGIEEMQLLPKGMASNAVATFNNPEMSPGERVGAVAALVMGTPDDAQQVAIYQQLVKAGVPEHATAAFAALARGDQNAAQRLFAAVMTDPASLPGKLPVTPAEINTAIQEKIFAENQIGDVVYQITDGTAENLEQVRKDGILFERSVKLRLLTNQAISLEDAIDQTAKDMFGDVEVMTGSRMGGAGVKITVPKGEDTKRLQMGFDALLPRVSEYLMASKDFELASLPEQGTDRAMAEAMRDNFVQDSIANGLFVPMGDGFAFLTPMGAPVLDENDQPVTFSKDDVIAAGAYAGAGGSFDPWAGSMFNPTELGF